MKKYFLLLCGFTLLSGCVALKPDGRVIEKSLEPEDCVRGESLGPVVVYPSSDSYHLLSCLSDTSRLERKEFDKKFALAEAGLENGRNLDKLEFICMSLNAKADDKQFKNGVRVLEQYLADHPDSGEDLQGFRILVKRLDEEIMNRWSAWKSLLNDKNDLIQEVESLKVKVEEQQKQIDQLKDIEKIIKSREVGLR